MCPNAGILQLVYYDSQTRKLYSLDASWNSYLAEIAVSPPFGGRKLKSSGGASIAA